MVKAHPPPAAVEPLYTCDVDERILLHAGPVKLSDGSVTLEGSGALYYAWQPYEGPEFETDIQLVGLNDEHTIEFPDLGLRAAVLPRRSAWGATSNKVLAIVNGDVEVGNFLSVTKVHFHVGNFHSVIGEPILRGTTHLRARIELTDGTWNVRIDPVQSITAFRTVLPEELHDARGRMITHSGILERVDGGVLERSEALDVLRDVGRTLSLARGSFSTPLLLSAYDVTGKNQWRCWSAFRTDPWSSHETWFSKNRPNILGSVFAGWRALASSSSRDIVSAAAHLFVDAHSAGLALESRLILMQAALEGLAHGWPHHPLPTAPPIPPMQSPAAKRIAAIAVSLGLPLATDALRQPELSALLLPSAAAPALEKMAWVRNSIAHLGNLPRMSPYSWKLKYEAKQLAALHLELALLRLLNASGQYLNRVSGFQYGEEVELPWT